MHMGLNLTKDADRLLCTIYKEYLLRRKSGISKLDAKNFREFDSWSKELFPHANYDNLKETVCELTKALHIPMNMECGFWLSDEAIVYMENRFRDGMVGVLSFLSQFLP